MTDAKTAATSASSQEMAAVIEKLRPFDTATVCNVIELFDLRPHHKGYLGGSIKSYFPDLPPMVGFAYTCTYSGGEPGPNITLGENIDNFAKTPEPRVMVFQSLESPPASAIFGDIAVSFYKKFGCVGLVTDGGGRDFEQIRELEFPCFAAETICSHGYARVTAVNIPVTLTGQEILPGDLLHGDANGVAIVPIEIASAVADLCGPMRDAESDLLGKVNAPGATVQEVSRAHREFLAACDELTRIAAG